MNASFTYKYQDHRVGGLSVDEQGRRRRLRELVRTDTQATATTFPACIPTGTPCTRLRALCFAGPVESNAGKVI